MADKLLTDTAIRGALVRAEKAGKDEWLADSTGRGDGRLSLRARPFGGFWVFSYAPAPGKFDRLEFGRYVVGRDADTTGAAYTLRQAREQAARFAELLKHPATRNVRAHQAEVAAKAEAARRAEQEKRRREAREREQAEKFTLDALLAAYVRHLRRHDKKSADDVEAMLERHVIKAHPDLAKLPAGRLSKDEATRIIRVILEAGIGRTAGMVRSYLHAAYSLAATADTNADAPSEMLGFDIEHNPFTVVKGTAKHNKARTRTLNEKELRHLLPRLRAWNGAGARVVLAALYSGGQRPEQILSAPRTAWNGDEGTLRIADPKGRRTVARVYVLPLADGGRALLEGIAADSDCFYELHSPETPAAERFLFPSLKKQKTGGGITRLQLTTASKVITGTSKAMVKAKESPEPFQMKDVRRTVENLFKRLRVAKEDRARLMSHGLGDVQERHYITENPDEYREPLVALERRLAEIENGAESRVVHFPRASA